MKVSKLTLIISIVYFVVATAIFFLFIKQDGEIFALFITITEIGYFILADYWQNRKRKE